MDKQILDDYMQMLRSYFNPNYIGFAMHPEEGKDAKINDEFDKIKTDLEHIDNKLIEAGEQVYRLMNNTILRLNNIYTNIMMEKERFQDMQMLCNKYNDYDNVKLLDKTSYKGEFSYEDGIIAPYRTSARNVRIAVVDVSGNGYEGNKYVYKDYIYTNTVLNTALKNNITDKKDTTYYEYSRITVSNSEYVENKDFNKDNIEARCTITFQAEDDVNEIEITSDDTHIKVLNVAYSLDGKEYVDLDIPYISINNKLDSYGNYGYIYGSGKIVFPYKVRLFKITFESDGYQNDTLAYEQKLLPVDPNYNEPIIGTPALEINDQSVTTQNTITNVSDVMPEVDEVTTVVKSARRHVIRINGVSAGMYQYPAKTKIQTHELLNEEVYAIAVFANVYVPQGLNDDAVKFILTVNGRDYEVVPINSHKNGVKVIRFSTGYNNSTYTERIGEKIKSAYLSIIFTNTSKVTPYINNVKILLGGEL